MTDIKLYNTPQKEPEMNIWMAFPSMQSFGMSSLGYMSIVKTIDQRKDYFIEKIFTDMVKKYLDTSKNANKLKQYMAIGIGFVDGNLNVIYKN